MKTACPSCGAEIEFRYDDSFVRVCEYCHAAVARTDRGVDSLGKVADLVPMDSPLRLFADGQLGAQLAGGAPPGIPPAFILVGMAQIRHQAGGLTQEWYAKFSGTWGWLAEAQGRYYMTFEVEGAQLPPIESLRAGSQLQLPTMLGATKTFTVAEVAGATYVAATGELPFRLVPQGSYRFADLADGEGNFATIDYGEPGDTPTLYVGQQLTLADLHIAGGEIAPPRDERITSTRLACPNCNGPIDLRAPDQTLRVACAYCSHVLDLQQGSLRVLEKLAIKADPRIPLGSKGTFPEGEMTLIGYVQRSAEIEGDWYAFDEYLLYEPAIGFRWLVCSDGHWSYVQPIATGAADPLPSGTRYDGVKFRRFQAANLRVDTVVGEFYWKVFAGEQVYGEDYVAPPAMISRESTSSEENWSLSTYMKPAAVTKAFGKELPLPRPTGVAPNQPDPTAGVSTPLTLGFLALLALGIVFASIAPAADKYTTDVLVPAGVVAPPEPVEGAPEPPTPPNVFFSEPFALEGDKNVELAFRANLSNNWAYTVASLVNVASGDVVTVDAAMEYYSGYEDGESWSEGKDHASEVVSPVPAGQYVLRLESQHGGTTGDVAMAVRVRQGVFRARYLALAVSVLGIPFLIFGIYSFSFERRRWSNSTEGSKSMPKTPLIIVVGGIALVLYGIVAVIKAIAEASSDD